MPSLAIVLSSYALLLLLTMVVVAGIFNGIRNACDGIVSQHFLLTAAARSLSLAQVARRSDEEARDTFKRIRWSETAGEPICPECGLRSRMVPIELAGFGRPHRGHNAVGIPAKDRAVRHVGQACDREGSRAHGVRQVVVRRRFRRDPGLTAMRMDIDRDGFAQDIESGSGGLGRPGGGCRTLRHNTSGEHCVDRNQAGGASSACTRVTSGAADGATPSANPARIAFIIRLAVLTPAPCRWAGRLDADLDHMCSFCAPTDRQASYQAPALGRFRLTVRLAEGHIGRAIRAGFLCFFIRRRSSGNGIAVQKFCSGVGRSDERLCSTCRGPLF